MVKKIIAKYDGWIQKKISMPLSYQYIDGEYFYLRGKKYRLTINYGSADIQIINDTLIVAVDKAQNVKPQLLSWFKQNAMEWLIYRTQIFKNIIKINYAKVKIGDYKSMWGSCTSKGVISYNWRIIMAPEEVIDYLIVHELCHLIVGNHSKKYWKTVAKFLPDYKNRQKWLRANEDRMRAM